MLCLIKWRKTTFAARSKTRKYQAVRRERPTRPCIAEQIDMLWRMNKHHATFGGLKENPETHLQASMANRLKSQQPCGTKNSVQIKSLRDVMYVLRPRKLETREPRLSQEAKGFTACWLGELSWSWIIIRINDEPCDSPFGCRVLKAVPQRNVSEQHDDRRTTPPSLYSMLDVGCGICNGGRDNYPESVRRFVVLFFAVVVNSLCLERHENQFFA